MIYKEKSKTVQLIGDYIERVDQSANVGELISELGRERRLSYQYAIKKTGHKEVEVHRLLTDSIITVIKNGHDLALANFTRYTFLDHLSQIRAIIDTSSNYPPDNIVQFYTDVIVRLNTLNATIPSNTFLKDDYQDLVSQKILSEMITYLEIMRTNIFNALYMGEYSLTALTGPQNVYYKLYKSYETEFLMKASPNSISVYNNEKKLTEYGPTMEYIDKLFGGSKFDTTYDSNEWWTISTRGVIELRKQQRALWKSVDIRIKEMSTREKNSKNLTLIFLTVSILFVIGFVTYFINDITKLLRELKLAARKISKGGTDLQLKNMPAGVIGNLAKSIKQIDKNNLLLAEAASQIGKGNFDQEVKPRSEEDLLGISIRKMQNDLREFTSQKDKIQKETEDLVYKRDEFFSVASHELRTPVTSIKAYTQLLLMDAEGSGDVQRQKMLNRMNVQVNKLTVLISDLLDISKLQNGQLAYHKEPFILEELVNEIVEEIQPTSPETQLLLKSSIHAIVNADRDRIGQVLSNLLVNATKYAHTSKEIIVELQKKGDKVICSVHDFGNGILPDEYDKIFERFYRISGDNLNTFPGLGLGLFISKEIIEKHDGKIWLQSEKGKGTIFYFELPMA
ncbi:MAG: ATP-binding protein [Ginsengibacter sp.]